MVASRCDGLTHAAVLHLTKTQNHIIARGGDLARFAAINSLTGGLQCMHVQSNVLEVARPDSTAIIKAGHPAAMRGAGERSWAEDYMG